MNKLTVNTSVTESILGVIETLPKTGADLDTSNTTATSGDILYPKSACVNSHLSVDNIQTKSSSDLATGGFWFNIYKSPAYSSSATSVIDAGDTHAVMSKPIRGGCVFQSWVDEDGNVYKTRNKITLDGDMKLTVSWKYNS